MMNQTMTTLLATTLALALFPASQLQAQPDQARHHGPPDAEMRVSHMSRALELSEEQSARLLEVFQAVDEERQALHEQVMLQMKPQLCERQLATRAEVQEILDAEQLAILEDKKARRESNNNRKNWRGMRDLDCSAYE